MLVSRFTAAGGDQKPAFRPVVSCKAKDAALDDLSLLPTLDVDATPHLLAPVRRWRLQTPKRFFSSTISVFRSPVVQPVEFPPSSPWVASSMRNFDCALTHLEVMRDRHAATAEALLPLEGQVPESVAPHNSIDAEAVLALLDPLVQLTVDAVELSGDQRVVFLSTLGEPFSPQPRPEGGCEDVGGERQGAANAEGQPWDAQGVEEHLEPFFSSSRRRPVERTVPTTVPPLLPAPTCSAPSTPPPSPVFVAWDAALNALLDDALLPRRVFPLFQKRIAWEEARQELVRAERRMFEAVLDSVIVWKEMRRIMDEEKMIEKKIDEQ
ncbi:hypothetical protein JCM8547_002653 [Rhodosporidiobolus lusitaniae]